MHRKITVKALTLVFFLFSIASFAIDNSEEEEVMKDKNGNDVSVVTMNLQFRKEIPLNVYDYFMLPT